MGCGARFDEFVRASDLAEFVAAVDAGKYTHTLDWDNLGKVTTSTCGVCEYVKISLCAAHQPLADYPFVTAPWFLPPNADGTYQQVEVHSRAQYKRLLKENSIVEPETTGDRLTMYKDRVETTDDRIDREIGGDMEFYEQMKRNPDARKRIIKSAVQRREAAGI